MASNKDLEVQTLVLGVQIALDKPQQPHTKRHILAIGIGKKGTNDHLPVVTVIQRARTRDVVVDPDVAIELAAPLGDSAVNSLPEVDGINRFTASSRQGGYLRINGRAAYGLRTTVEKRLHPDPLNDFSSRELMNN